MARKSAWRDYKPLSSSNQPLYSENIFYDPLGSYQRQAGYMKDQMYTIYVHFNDGSVRCLGTKLQAHNKDSANRKYVEHLVGVSHSVIFPTPSGVRFTPPSSTTWKSEAL
jgi:hypothetical protein